MLQDAAPGAALGSVLDPHALRLCRCFVRGIVRDKKVRQQEHTKLHYTTQQYTTLRGAALFLRELMRAELAPPFTLLHTHLCALCAHGRDNSQVRTLCPCTPASLCRCFVRGIVRNNKAHTPEHTPIYTPIHTPRPTLYPIHTLSRPTSV